MIRTVLLTPNPYSRPGLKLRRVDCIVLHWVENEGTSAEFNRRYFESLAAGLRDKNGKILKASAHYLIDSREIIQDIPDDEVAHGVGASVTDWAKGKWGEEFANYFCIHIEHCHPTESGNWEPGTLHRSHVLSAGLCLAYELNPLRDIIRHYDITRKDCPRWLVHDREAFARYRDVVAGIMEA